MVSLRAVHHAESSMGVGTDSHLALLLRTARIEFARLYGDGEVLRLRRCCGLQKLDDDVRSRVQPKPRSGCNQPQASVCTRPRAHKRGYANVNLYYRHMTMGTFRGVSCHLAQGARGRPGGQAALPNSRTWLLRACRTACLQCAGDAHWPAIIAHPSRCMRWLQADRRRSQCLI